MKVWALFLALAVGVAQTPNKSVVGEISTVDASAKQFKVKGDDGVAYTVALDDNTSYLRMPLGEKDLKKAAKIAFSDVGVGDRLLARGALAEDTKTVSAKTVIIMTKADVAQKQERDRADWQRRGITGTVTAVNAAAKEITIETRAPAAKTWVMDATAAGFRRYAPDSVRFADAKPSSFAELQIGDTVRALGNKSEDQTHFKAEELVFGSFQTIAATVVSVDEASGEVRVTDLQSKKQITVKTNPNSMLRRLPEMVATMLARRLRGDSGAPGGNSAPGGNAAPGAGGAAAPGGLGGGAPAAGPDQPRGPGGSGFRGGGGDLQQILERAPQLTLSELKKGDALIISSRKSTDGSPVAAISLVAGVEPFLAAAPRTGGQVNLGSWNLDTGGIPEQ
jgi:hypothetical protein